MATFDQIKNTVLDTVCSYDLCDIWKYIDTFFNSPDDFGNTVILDFSEIFSCDNTVLNAVLTAVNALDGAFLAANKVLWSSVTDFTGLFRVIAGCNITNATIDADSNSVFIIDSNITNLHIANNVHIKVLLISGAGTVTNLTLGTGATIGMLKLISCNSRISELTTPISYVDSLKIEKVDIDTEDGSVFGGEACPDDTLVCSDEVTGITTDTIDDTSITFHWTLPTNNTPPPKVYYRREGEAIWHLVNDTGSLTGTITGTTAEIDGLDSNTTYDFLVCNHCSSPNAYSRGSLHSDTTDSGA